jgi:hypothetical protein
MTKPVPCWVCTGRSRSLCAKHKRAVTERAAKLKITLEAAAFQLRDFERDVEDKRIEKRLASSIQSPARTSECRL